jgi:hypothetical protein
MSKMLEALELLRVSNNLLEVAFWAADGQGEERDQAMACLIHQVQWKLEAAVALIKDDAGIDKPELEAA